MKLRLVLGSCALALVASACGGYDRQANLEELEDGGLTSEQAACVLDRAEDEIGKDRLGSNDDPTSEEIEIIQKATFDCVLAE